MNKLNIILASKEESSLSSVLSTLKADSRLNITFVDSAEKALQVIADSKIDVVVASEELQDTTGLQFINSVVAVNPFINCALVSPLSHDDFHEETEGLGIFMQLPVNPGEKSATEMLKLLDKIYQL